MTAPDANWVPALLTLLVAVIAGLIMAWRTPSSAAGELQTPDVTASDETAQALVDLEQQRQLLDEDFYQQRKAQLEALLCAMQDKENETR